MVILTEFFPIMRSVISYLWIVNGGVIAEHDESRMAKDARRDILSLERHNRRTLRDEQRHSEQAKVHALLELQRERQMERDRIARDRSWLLAQQRADRLKHDAEHDARMALSNEQWRQEFANWQARLDGIAQAARDAEEKVRLDAQRARQAVIDAEVAAQEAIEAAERKKIQDAKDAELKAQADAEWQENRRIWQERWKKHFIRKVVALPFQQSFPSMYPCTYYLMNDY
jgi:hypothetical protein